MKTLIALKQDNEKKNWYDLNPKDIYMLNEFRNGFSNLKFETPSITIKKVQKVNKEKTVFKK